MEKFTIKVSRKMIVYENTQYTVNAETLEEAKQIALADEINAKTPEDKGILNAEGNFDYSTLVPVTEEENYYMNEKSNGCVENFNPGDIKYKTVEIEVL
jgi:hypothetical protein